jgi:hypothetical protein
MFKNFGMAGTNENCIHGDIKEKIHLLECLLS